MKGEYQMENKQTVNEYKIISSQNVKLESQNNNHQPNVLEITLYSYLYIVNRTVIFMLFWHIPFLK